MPRGRPPKNKEPQKGTHTPMVCTRDPMVNNRDPIIQPQAETTAKRPYHPRRCIQASMPTVCPACGHNTRQDDGRHIDPVRARIVEYRTCIKCKLPLGAVRNMTDREKERLCKNAEVVKEYEESINS
jgi:hypothetical protein